MMKQAIGVDLGGTKLVAARINEKGEILQRLERATPLDGREDVLFLMFQLIGQLMTPEVIGIGVGSPGFVDSRDGRILSVVANIPEWASTKLAMRLIDQFQLPAFVENDANLAALGEQWQGNAKSASSFILLTLGTGVGSAVILEKEGILHGAHFQGAELGHSILYPNGRACGCGQKGCADRYLSGTAIEQSYEERAGIKRTSQEIFSDQTDPIALEVVDQFCQDLAIFLTTIKNVFDPIHVLIGGGLIDSQEIWLDRVKKYYLNQVNAFTLITIEPTGTGSDAGLYGAARLVFQRLSS